MSVWVYSITSKINGKRYIGITSQGVKRRWQGHLREALKDSPSMAIARAIRKYGESNFRFEVLHEAANRDVANALERELIAGYGTRVPSGYNNSIGGEYAPTERGFTHTEDTKAKMSAAAMGKPKSFEARKAMSVAKKGKPLAADHAAKIRLIGRKNKGKKRTPLDTVLGRIRRREEADRRGACRVEFCNGYGPWRARISLDGKTVHLGLFDTEDEAKSAYMGAAARHLVELYAERDALMADPNHVLVTGRAVAVEGPHRDRADTLRKMWADPTIRAEMAAKISAGRRHGAMSSSHSGRSGSGTL